MSWQHVELNMIPGGELPVVHVSQFDTLRAFHFDLKVGDDDWTIPEGIRFELHCRKVDDNIVIIAPDSTDTSSVTFTTTEQLTACSGKNECELVAIDDEDDSLIIGSINFILDVEADPLAGGLTSETAIYNLTQQIEEIAEQVIGEDYYDKTEVDDLLADKADVSDLPDMSQYYTKTATDTLLSAKADAATTYTKSETDSLLSAKANTADLATVATTGDYDDLLNKPTIPAAQVNSDWAAVSGVAEILNKPTIPTKTSDLNNDSDFQNETEVNNLIAAALLEVMPVDSATGSPCTFDTDISTSLVGLSADIVASQASGTPTPSNPLPISGISQLDIVANGNTFTIDLGGTRYGGVYTADGKLRVTQGYLALAVADMNNSNDFPGWTNSGVRQIIGANEQAYPDIIGNVGSIIGVNTNGSNDILFLPISSYNNLTQSDWISTYPDLIVQMVIPLATPIEIDVSAISVNAISGVNNISSNGNGDVTAQYKVSIQKYIDDHV